MKTFWRRPWVSVGLWTTLILIGTTMPVSGLPEVPRFSDKVVHALLYAVLGALLYRALLFSQIGEPQRRVVVLCILQVLLLSAAFAAFDEWHQQFVNRSTSLADWVADMVGVLGGAVWMAQWFTRRGWEARGSSNG